MRTKEVIATIAVVGAVATFAVLNMDSSSNSTFLKKSDEVYIKPFNHFIGKYGKRYGTVEEYNYRLKIFKENYHIVMDHNTMNDDSGFTMELNMFADMTNEEYKKRLGLKPIETKSGNP